MRRLTYTFFPVVLLLALLPFGKADSAVTAAAEHAPAEEGAATATEDAACPISIDLKNSANRRLGLVQSRSQVKVRRGFWRGVWARSNLQVTIYVEPGETKNTKSSLDFGCNAQRRYRFYVTDPGRSRSEYLYRPSTTSWTTTNARFTIDLAKAF